MYIYISIYIYINVPINMNIDVRTRTGIYIYRCENALSNYHFIFRQESVVHVCSTGKIRSMSHAHTATAAQLKLPPPSTVGY